MTDAAALAPLPPGPPDEVPLVDVRRDPLAFLEDLARRYGDMAHYRAPGWQAVLVNRPSAVRTVLLDRFRQFGKLGTPDLMMLKPMLGEGLLTVDDDTWRRQRRIVQPAFHRGTLAQFDGLIADKATAMLDGWAATAGDRFDLVDAMTELTLKIAALALFGHDIRDDAGAFGRAVEALNEAMGHMDPTDAERAAAFEKGLAHVRGVVARAILHRVAHPSTGDSLGAIMQALDIRTADQAMAARELHDQALTLLLAGHETTAKALSWTLYLLARHPDVAERIRAEAEAVCGRRAPTAREVDAMPVAWSVIQEAMRLYPPIWVMTRRAKADQVIDGYAVPAGALVVISPYLLHRRPDLWPEPEAFRPDRFLGRSPATESTDFDLLPFSGGPRHCVGKHLAELEMRIVLPMIVQRFRLDLDPDRPARPEALVTLRPAERMTVRARPHREGRA
ncbi:MAG: cytochrome P450 [Alphaproteobacteria bacterium]|jgi:cytochrome P450|nr:cytochrome P450 [Alphaproteobacteria bacterium]